MITRSKTALPAVAATTSSYFRATKASLAAKTHPTKANVQGKPPPPPPARGVKRSKSESSLVDAAAPPAAKKTRRSGGPATAVATAVKPIPVETVIEIPAVSDAELLARTKMPYPSLTFSLDEATAHLCRCDPRFRRLVDVVPIRTYDELSRAHEGETRELDLYRTLSTSILGQQISWLAARSILYKFCRVFDPDMPPKPDFEAYPRESWPFPSPRRVLEASDASLREAGLSYAKIRYIKDLALRFCDGRLDIRQVVGMEQQDIVAKLCEVKGVGRWTSEMILMFAMRAPDILPVGDLGVQKGMVNFYLAGEQGPKISVKKRKPGAEADDEEGTDEAIVKAESNEGPQQPSLGADDDGTAADAVRIPEIPEGEGLSRKVLEERQRGNKVKGQYLTPKEMECLAASWSPFRSVACMYMWALVDA